MILDNIGKIILSIYGLTGLIVLIIIIFLIVRRSRIRKQETFEKREN